MDDWPHSQPPEKFAFPPEQLWALAAALTSGISFLFNAFAFQSLDKKQEHFPTLAHSILVSNSYPRSCKLEACRCLLLGLLGFCFLNKISYLPTFKKSGDFVPQSRFPAFREQGEFVLLAGTSEWHQLAGREQRCSCLSRAHALQFPRVPTRPSSLVTGISWPHRHWSLQPLHDKSPNS